MVSLKLSVGWKANPGGSRRLALYLADWNLRPVRGEVYSRRMGIPARPSLAWLPNRCDATLATLKPNSTFNVQLGRAGMPILRNWNSLNGIAGLVSTQGRR